MTKQLTVRKVKSKSKTTTVTQTYKLPTKKVDSFEIEADLPIPEQIRGVGMARRDWPFDKMAVGDSFLVPFDTEEGSKVREDENGNLYLVRQSIIQGAVGGENARRKKDGDSSHFTCRKTEDGYRVWRDA